jgi:hypothetical protein
MTIPTPTGFSPNSMARAATNAARFVAGSRVRLLVLGAAVLGLGLTFNWSWLVAAGIAPVILSLAPCAIMCALGLCMAGMAGRSSDKQPSTPSATSEPDPGLTSPLLLTASSDGSADPPTTAAQPARATEIANTESCCSPQGGPLMRKSIQTLGLASVLVVGLTAAPLVYGADTWHSSSAMGTGMMNNGEKQGMMKMMGQMSQMMETCNNMMQSGMQPPNSQYQLPPQTPQKE